jgi:hypothetical protein
MDPYFTQPFNKDDARMNPNAGIAARSGLLACLDQQTTLTGNQWRIIAAAILGDMLEFFDYLVAGLSFLLFGIETRGTALETIGE